MTTSDDRFLVWPATYRISGLDTSQCVLYGEARTDVPHELYDLAEQWASVHPNEDGDISGILVDWLTDHPEVARSIDVQLGGYVPDERRSRADRPTPHKARLAFRATIIALRRAHELGAWRKVVNSVRCFTIAHAETLQGVLPKIRPARIKV